MSVRNDFKKAVLLHIEASFPTGFALCRPNHNTKEFLGEDEWGQIFIEHATGGQHSHGAKSFRRYKRLGTVIARCHLKPGQGDKRSDELAEAWQNMFDGMNIAGIDSTFTEVRAREVGLDDDSRYNILLCEAVFEYREIK